MAIAIESRAGERSGFAHVDPAAGGDHDPVELLVLGRVVDRGAATEVSTE
jgi:hypothetical protein